MRKFIVYTRPIPGCQRPESLKIVEVECQIVSGMEDPSVMWLPNEEYKVRILEPKFLSEAGKDGQLVPPVYYSSFLYWTPTGASVVAEGMLREELDRRDRKQGIPFSEEEYQAKCAEIQIIRL